MINFMRKHETLLIRILLVFTALAAIKSILTDTGFDNAYSVAMSYRHLNGDSMFKYMWEPHQTSIIVTDILMWIYHIFVPSYAGVMIYLQICGTLMLGLLGFGIYKVLKTEINPTTALLAGIFFFIFRAKQTPFPEFANLQIGFSVLVFLMLAKFLKNQERWWLLCFSAVFLCLEVLAYPSCVITYLPIAIFLVIRTKDKWKNVGIFTATCAVIGLCYVLFFVLKIGFSEFLGNISNIFYSDSHQTGESIVGNGYFNGVLTAILWIIVTAIVALAVCFVAKKIFHKTFDFLPFYGLFLLVSEIVMLLAQSKTGIDWTCTFYILPAFLVIFGAGLGYSKMNETEKSLWILGVLIGVSSAVAAWALTDLGLITIIPYMVFAGVISFIPLSHAKGQAVTFLIAICAIATVHRGLVVWGYANIGRIWMVNGIETIIKAGPSAGVVCDYMTGFQMRADMEDHPAYISEEDRVLFVGGWIIDSMEFLLTGADISNYSTIDTPIYNERLVTYYEQYPEKKPTVIAVTCSYGTLLVPEDSFVMEWINDNYEVSGEGRFWRYYREK